MIKTYIYFILFIIVTACNEQKPTFDYNSWKNDVDGCLEQRISLIDSYNTIEPYLLGKSEKKIIQILGAPDVIELNKRHIKTFIYYLDPNNLKCKNKQVKSRVSCIEFNSIGRSNIISQQVR